MATFEPGIEGAQHGALTLADFLTGVSKAGAKYAQLSNYQIHDPAGKDWQLLSVKKVKSLARRVAAGTDLGASAHCPIYMATGGLQVYTAETLPFHHPAFKTLGGNLASKGPKKLVEDYLPRLFDWYSEAGIKVVAHFWGPIYDPDSPTGNLDSRYGWPFIKDEQLKPALENHAELVRPILDLAQDRGLVLAHEPHPKTAAWSPQEWELVKEAVGKHKSNKINADPSHAWNGQTVREMFTHPAMRDDVVIAHFKDHELVQGLPRLTWLPKWKDRGMQFCPLGDGCIDLRAFARLLVEIGAVERFMAITGLKYFPAICEAEATYEDGWQTAQAGIKWLGANICWWKAAKGSFEDGMGEAKKSSTT